MCVDIFALRESYSLESRENGDATIYTQAMDSSSGRVRGNTGST